MIKDARPGLKSKVKQGLLKGQQKFPAQEGFRELSCGIAGI
jgi:hypothetical protein